MYKPELNRPFKMPGGVVGGAVAALSVVFVMCVMVYLSAVSGDVVLGIKHAKIIGLVIILSLGVSENIA